MRFRLSRPSGASPPSSYYDYLIAQAELQDAWLFDSQNDIDNNTKNGPKANTAVDYDPAEVAARCNMVGTSLDTSMQLQPDFSTPIGSGIALFVWDVKYDSRFASLKDSGTNAIAVASGDPLEQHKQANLLVSGSIALETQTRYDDITEAAGVGRVTMRYYSAFAGSGGNGVGQASEFNVQPNTRTRYFEVVDWDAQEVELWVADENTAPQLVVDYGSFGGSFGTFNAWRVGEHNSSQDGTFADPLYIWNYWLVALVGIANRARAEAIIAQSSF